ncbi:MAG: hypothetical protein F6K24_31890 [Okeania sp. SIO2D1]|nr:hypothetical protein [Okeania sp. SIO2D1]
MSNRRRPQWKQEVNIKMSLIMTFYIGFMKQNMILDALYQSRMVQSGLEFEFELSRS